MVTINRQAAPRPDNGQTTGTILRRVMPLKDVPMAPLKVLVYGGNGVGKTTFACQANKPILLVSFEPSMSGGVDSVRRMGDISVIRVVPDGSPLLKTRTPDAPIITMDESVTLAHDLQSDPSRFATVVYDGATSSQDIVHANLLDLPEVPNGLTWGTTPDKFYIQRSEKFREYVRPYLDLPIDTIVLAKEKDHNPPTEEKTTKSGKLAPDMRPKFLRGVGDKSFVSVDVGGGPAGWLVDACSCTCRLYVGEGEVQKVYKVGTLEKVVTEKSGKFVRYLRTGYHPNFAARIQSCNPESVPDELVGTGPTADAASKDLWQKLMIVIRGR